MQLTACNGVFDWRPLRTKVRIKIALRQRLKPRLIVHILPAGSR
jgi:hypothetical protein